MKRLGAQELRRLSEEDCKQSINDIFDQCGDIFRDTHNQKALKCEYESHLKCDNVRKNVFDFMVKHIKKSKQNKDDA